MKLPRDLSGADLARCICRHFGYRREHPSGSHIILDTDEPVHQRLPIPDHNPMRIGTFNAIIRAVAKSRGVTQDDILAKL